MIIDQGELSIWRSLAFSDPGWSMWTHATPAYVEHLLATGMVEAASEGPDQFRLTDLGRSYAFDVLKLEV